MMKRTLNPISDRENGDRRSPLPVFSVGRALCLFLICALLSPFFEIPARAAEPGSGESSPLAFSDVPADAWYREDVAAAVSAGFVNGRTPTVFAPLEPVLRSEAVKLAVCLRERLETGAVVTKNGSPLWYSSYAEAARNCGILAEEIPDAGWTEPASRGEIFSFFARALPEPPEEINEIPEDSIPDVPGTHPHAAGIYLLYRAGAAQGTDGETHAASPDAPVTRAECAATLMRLYDPAGRIRFSMNAADDGEDPGILGREWSERTLAQAAAYESRFGEGTADEILMTPEEIAAYNASMTAACPTLEDLAAWPDTVDGSLVSAKIGAYVFPAGYDYDAHGNYVGDETRQAILDNRALNAIPASVSVGRAIVTTRCDLRSFPSSVVFAPKGNPGFDRAQETELSVGTPVCVLHKSADGNYLFVQAYHYAGWIPAESAASCGKETFERYARRDPETGVTITSPSVTVGGVRLDMGVWLPFSEVRGGDYEVILPIRGEDGTCLSAVYALNPSDAVRGVLPYTVKNFYEQAFRYLGVFYGWGGKDGGVDCSGFVCSVMRTFGFMLPRNTSEQRIWAGKTTDLSGLGAEARISALSASRFPTAIYKKGHVMFFLGVEEGRIKIIHAHSIGNPVSLESIDPSGDLLTMAEFRP